MYNARRDVNSDRKNFWETRVTKTKATHGYAAFVLKILLNSAQTWKLSGYMIFYFPFLWYLCSVKVTGFELIVCPELVVTLTTTV